MAAELENGFFVRFPAWHGLGQVIAEAPDSEAALKLAGLNWTVEQAMAFAEMPNGIMQETPYMMNYRTSEVTHWDSITSVKYCPYCGKKLI